MEDLLERLGYRREGFRRVRRRVLRRIERRIRELGLPSLDAYRGFLERTDGEWQVLDKLANITISKFYRDRALFDHLRRDVLPDLARKGGRCWSAGCASGEEPFTLALLSPGIEIVATDRDPVLLERARKGIYRASSLKDLPEEGRARGFEAEGGDFRLRDEFRARVAFRLMDLRHEMPDGPFDLVFCRYVAFTYFAETLQTRILEGIAARLAPEGLLAIGRHERLPPGPPFVRAAKGLNLFRRVRIPPARR